MPLSDCRLIDLPKAPNLLGNLTFIEGERHIPFAIQRVYYLYDVPGGAERGGHAHRELQQLIIAMSGSFDVVLDDGYHVVVHPPGCGRGARGSPARRSAMARSR